MAKRDKHIGIVVEPKMYDELLGKLELLATFFT
ncbi:unnamed protein product, partial [marine sediment metagenome]